MDVKEIIPRWADGLDCAVTVCDADAVVIYMNERSAMWSGIVFSTIIRLVPRRLSAVFSPKGRAIPTLSARTDRKR